MREASDDPELFNFEFSDPENEKITFLHHAQYSFEAKFRNRSTGESYSVESLSSGEKILMSLCLAAFNRNMGRRQPGLLLLDELDAVLHPSMAYGATKWPRLVARIAEAGLVAGRGCSPSPQDMPDALHVLVIPVAGWVNRRPEDQIAYLREEQRGLRAWRLGGAWRVPVVGRGGTQRWRPTPCAH